MLERRLQRLEPGWEKVDHVGHDEDQHRAIEHWSQFAKEDKDGQCRHWSWQHIAGIGGLQAAQVQHSRAAAGEVGERQADQHAAGCGTGGQDAAVPDEPEEPAVERCLCFGRQAPLNQ